MKALAIAATGMTAQQLNVEVIANNIANINTTAFKRSRAEFTDLLYQTYRAQRNGENIEPIFRRVRERYLSIAEELGLSFPIARELDEVEQLIFARLEAK